MIMLYLDVGMMNVECIRTCFLRLRQGLLRAQVTKVGLYGRNLFVLYRIIAFSIFGVSDDFLC